jgi:hypothetical protein
MENKLTCFIKTYTIRGQLGEELKEGVALRFRTEKW